MPFIENSSPEKTPMEHIGSSLRKLADSRGLEITSSKQTLKNVEVIELTHASGPAHRETGRISFTVRTSFRPRPAAGGSGRRLR